MDYVDLLVKVLVALAAVAGAVGAIFSYLRTRRLTALEELTQRRHEVALQSTSRPMPFATQTFGSPPSVRFDAPVRSRASAPEPGAEPVPLAGLHIDWFKELQERLGPDAGERARLLVTLLSRLGLKIRLTSNQNSVAFDLRPPGSAQSRALFWIYKEGKLEIGIGHFVHFAGMADEQWRQSVLDRLVQCVPGYKITAAGIRSYPRVDLLQPIERDAWEGLTGVIAEIVEYARR